MFYMNMRAFNEGEQADAYKKRKREEELNDWKSNRQRHTDVDYSKDGKSKVYNAATRSSDYDKDKGRNLTKAEKNGLDEKKALEHEKKMRDIAQKSSEITRKESENRNNSRDFDDEYRTAMDATNRHLRRHPKNECGIFESVKII